MAVKRDFGKQMIWIIVVIITIAITVISYNLIIKTRYQRNYQDVRLDIISNYAFDMCDRPNPYWMCITDREQFERITKKYNWDLPDIDFGTEMYIISYGSELENLRYNLKESTYKTRGKYIGFPYFKQEDSENEVFIYRTSLIPLMDTDMAGYPPDYKGMY